MAKFNISDIPTQGVVVKTTYPHEAASFNSAGNYVPWYYDDAMNPEPLPPATPSATSENLYGHVTLAIRHRPDVWYQYRDLVETSDSSEFSTTCDSDTSDVIWARGVGALQRTYDGVDEWFHIESGVAVPIMSDVGWNKKVGVSGNLQGDCSSSFWNQTVIDQDTARLWGYWTQGDSTEYDWWGLEQATGHSYGGTTAYHYFAPGETCPYHILIYEYLAPSGEKGSEFSAKVWPQVMYLWF